MLTINATPLRATQNDAAAASPSSGDSPADPSGFSSMLRESQAATEPKAAAPATHAEPAARKPDHATDHEPTHAADHDTDAPARTDEPAASEASDPTDRTRAPLKTRLRGNDAAPRIAKPVTDARTSDAKPTDQPVADTTANPAAASVPSAPLDPNIAQWLAALQRPVPAAKTGDTAQTTTDANAPAVDDGRATSKGARPDALGAGPDPKEKTDRSASRFAEAADAAGLVAVRTEARTTEAVTSSATHVTATDNLAGASLQPMPTALRETAAPASVAIATPVDSPDFAQTLGVQMSVFAKDGVQQAELHLNPAEMGPVSVQIVMDGTQARIDFGADVAATRHAIEAGLPELASALRDAGFTLAGGGVSQHSGQRGGGSQADGGHARRNSSRVSESSVARVGTAARRIVTQGGVDLYA